MRQKYKVLSTVELQDLTSIKGISFPRGVRFRQIIVTGPPGSGKSSFITKLGGWPEEGYLDLAQKGWWHSPVLVYRPREVHFGLPFVDFDESHAVFDREWLERPADLDLERIRIPPEKQWLLGTDWRNKYVFDFQLLPPRIIFAIRSARADAGTHPVDAALTEQQVALQVKVYEDLALHFHRHGLRVLVRTLFDGKPRRISEG